MENKNISFDLDKGKAFFLSDIESDGLNESGKVLNAVYTGEYQHHSGSFELKEDHIDEFIKNFESNVLGIQPAVNFNHIRNDKAAGWIVGMSKRNISIDLSNGTTREAVGLDIDVNWTQSGIDSIKGGEYKYFSIEFTFEFVNSETQAKTNNVVTGGAITNIPFLKQTQVALEEGDINSEEGVEVMKKDEMLLSLKKDYDLDVQALQDNAKELESAKLEIVSLTEMNDRLKKDLHEVKKSFEKEKIDTLLSDLIKSGKSSQKLNDEVYSKTFNAVGYEEASKMCAVLLESEDLIKKQPIGSSSTHLSDEEPLTDSERFEAQAEKISKEEGISFEEAVQRVLK